MSRPRLTYANVVATLAMVFAMTGGAYAASKILITSTKQIKPSVLAQLKGKAGKAGANGAPGAAGPAGPAGAQGPAGANGKEGPQGKEGPAGKDGTNGKNGSQGEEGPPGPEGVCSTSACHLPANVTETGTWSFSVSAAGFAPAPVSFSIPLGAALDETHVIYVGGAGSASAHCPGTTEAPAASPGYLCVYQQFVQGVKSSGSEGEADIFPGAGKPTLGFGGTPGAGTSGAVVMFLAEEAAFGWGTWAVTG